MNITSSDWMIVAHIWLAAGALSGNIVLWLVAVGFVLITARAYTLEVAPNKRAE